MSNWDESKHPRVPEGHSGGGQFTSKGSPEDYEVYYSDGLDDAEKEQFADSFEGEARIYLEEALDASEDGLPVVFLMKDGEPYAFFQGGIIDGYTSDEIGPDPYTLMFLGSCAPGGGTAALAEAIREAYNGGATGLFLEASPSAVGFYEKMGMHREESGYDSPMFYFTEDELELITKEYYKRTVLT